MKYIDGGVCAAKGYIAGGIHCGIRKNKTKRDLAMIKSEVKAAAAAVYTQNLVKGAPITVTKNNIADGFASAVIVNSGIANTCNADGIEKAEAMCEICAKALNVDARDVIVASTGVIGQPLNLVPIQNGINELKESMSVENAEFAAEAIMTTDTIKKQVAVEFEIDGVTCKIGGMAKGSGMIHPNMATMLGFITTDTAISPAMLKKALSEDIQDTFNMISVDRDTSTNDMVCVMANGLAGNKEITDEGNAFDTFKKALNTVTVSLSRLLASDGEGASKLVECEVCGAKDKETARICAKSVITSNLTKAAMFGADANWGRVLCALGYSGADIDVNKIDVDFKSEKGIISVCKNGAGIPFDEDTAKEILLQNEIEILVNLNDGDFNATAWGCDLTYDYVKINGDYRT